MPELPDITVYLDALERCVVGRALTALDVHSPFVLRSVDPPVGALVGTGVTCAERIGKRIVLGFEHERFLVIHLMIAGRLKWLAPGRAAPGKLALAMLHFGDDRIVLTEAAKKKRASMHVVSGRDALAQFDRGGLDVLRATDAAFAERLRSESHTLKRALTDPRLFDGIGNAYSDEILHRARLSPLLLTSRMHDEAIARLHRACIGVLTEWIARLRADTGTAWPDKVTAFRDGMAVHGRFRQPCPVCGSPVQRIRYAANETNYCAECQTGGRLLADRALSRLLKSDWPRSIDEYDGMMLRGRGGEGERGR